MDLLAMVEKHVPLRRVSSSKGGEWHGPCPACGTSEADAVKSDRFVVWPARDGWMCRNCGAGDGIEFLRKFENMSCPDAHKALGKECASVTCAVKDKCRIGRGSAPAHSSEAALKSPHVRKSPENRWLPSEARNPETTWREKASALVEWAHQKLLRCQRELDYLEGRGLPLEAVKMFRLGWVPKDLYRERPAWGLPSEISEKTGKPKRLWIPSGIVIPYFDDKGVHRVRIRQPEKQPRYYWLPGSGDDVLIFGDQAKAHVVVESDLDAMLIAWLAGDLVSAVPLGTCSARPKTRAAAALEESLCILVALDFEPRQNPQTGQEENPGGKAAAWWSKNFQHATRWPVPHGKDPGEYHQAGGDLRTWIAAGLPPGLRIFNINSQRKG